MPEPAFSAAEHDARLAKVRGAMERAGIGTLIVTDPSNMNWLTGYDGWSFYVHQAVVVTGEGAPWWWGRPMDAVGARLTTRLPDARIRSYDDSLVQNPERHPYETLADLLSGVGAQAPLGVEMDNYYFSAKCLEVLHARLPGTAIADATALVNWQRAVKSPPELALMREAGRIVEAMHARIREMAKPGIRKCDLIAEVTATGIRGADGKGGDYPAIVPLAPSGAEAAAAHLTWDDAPMRAGEGTFFEIAGVRRRYHAPCCRTLHFGEPPEAMRRAEAAVLEGLDAMLAALVPGETCERVAAALTEALARHGFAKESRCGYPIGLSYPPDWGERTMSLRAGDRTVLEEGMTFHLMPALWQGDWGLEITETAVVADGGGRCLADVPRGIVVR